MRLPRPLELALRLLLVVGLLLGLAHWHAKPLVQSLLPLFAWVFSLLDDHYRILSLSIASEGADTVVRLQVTMARVLAVGGYIVMPDPRGLATVTTAIGTVLQAPMLTLATALVWPFKSATDLAVRLSSATVLMAVLCLIDTPFCLWAYLWQMHMEVFDTDGFSPLSQWQEFLNNGGRILLGLCSGFAAIAAGTQIIGRRRNAITSMPKPLSNKA